MRTISIQVQGDHLETLARTRSPIDAVAEMIWNSVDADATLVQVSLDSNAIGGLRAVRVLDKVDIDNPAMLQLQGYAEAVAQDARFKETRTKWVFWALSNEVKGPVRNTARQPHRPEGLYYEDP